MPVINPNPQEAYYLLSGLSDPLPHRRRAAAHSRTRKTPRTRPAAARPKSRPAAARPSAA